MTDPSSKQSSENHSPFGCAHGSTPKHSGKLAKTRVRFEDDMSRAGTKNDVVGAGTQNDVVGRVDSVVGRGAVDSDESDLPRVSADVRLIRHISNPSFARSDVSTHIVIRKSAHSWIAEIDHECMCTESREMCSSARCVN